MRLHRLQGTIQSGRGSIRRLLISQTNADHASTFVPIEKIRHLHQATAHVKRDTHGEHEPAPHVKIMKGDRLMGTEVAEALFDIATTVMPYGISKEDAKRIANDFRIIIEDVKGLEKAFLERGE